MTFVSIEGNASIRVVKARDWGLMGRGGFAGGVSSWRGWALWSSECLEEGEVDGLVAESAAKSV